MYIKSLCGAGEIACKGHQDVHFGSEDSSAQQNWPGHEDTLQTIGELVRKKTAHST